jgi:hypothetical protein
MKTIAALVLFAALAAPAAAQDRIKIFVKAPVATDGFVDDTLKGQRDTFNDLVEQLSKKKTVEIVEAPEQADVSLSILDRNARTETGGTLTDSVRSPTGILSSTTKDTTKAVTITLTAGEYSKDLTASHDAAFGAWKYIAGNLAKQVEKWAKENRATILARRGR